MISLTRHTSITAGAVTCLHRPECQLLTFASNSMRMSACVRATVSNQSVTKTHPPRSRPIAQQNHMCNQANVPRSYIGRFSPARAIPRWRGCAGTRRIKSYATQINSCLKGILRTYSRISPLLRPPACPYRSRPCHPLAPTHRATAWAGRNHRPATGWPPTPPVRRAASSPGDPAALRRRGSAQRHPSVGCDP